MHPIDSPGAPTLRGCIYPNGKAPSPLSTIPLHTLPMDKKRTPLKCWIEAMRLRTLPVSVAGVIAALAYTLMSCASLPRPWTAAGCLIFAVLAQIASNFANEYYDFKAGLDAPGREGPRRGVTEGDISPRAMLIATIATLAAACAVGMLLAWQGGWWLIAAGVAIALGVLAYSAGPFPLSHHALGEVAVIAFFGIIPVNLTFYIQTQIWTMSVFMGSLTIGLMGANVLIVNNYRDLEADRAVGKKTLAVLFGRGVSSFLYLFNGWAAIYAGLPIWTLYGGPSWLVPVTYAIAHTLLWYRLTSRRGAALNPMLGATAALMLLYAIGMALTVTLSNF